MQWDSSPNAGFTTGSPCTELVKGDLAFQNVNVAAQLGDPHSLYHTIRKMIALRRRHAAFGGSSIEWVKIGNPTVAAYLRQNGDEVVLVLGNLSREAQSIVVPPQYRKDYLDLLSSSVVSLGAERELTPYSYLWLQPTYGE
jgi:glycosidase